MYCIDLRIDNLNWMTVSDIRRLLSNFRSLVCFHTGNVSLSKSILINDIKNFFPFLKYITLLISLDGSSNSSLTTRRSAITNDLFQEICASLTQINHLEHISLVLQDKNGKNRRTKIKMLELCFLGGCLSDLGARLYFRFVCEYISNMTSDCKLISFEENGYEIKNRFLSIDTAEETSFGSINISLLSTFKHLIISFRPMLNLNLTLAIKNSATNKLQIQTLVLPCVPSTSNSIDILDLNQLQILDIGYVNVKDRIELRRLDDILLCHRSLRNLTISLSEWQLARLVIVWKKEDNRQITTQFSSVFEDCFDNITTPEDIEKPTVVNQSPEFEKVSVLLQIEIEIDDLSILS